MNTKRNHFFDILKAISCIHVAVAHIQHPNGFLKWLVYLGYFAVPLFFMISGYYYKNDKDTVKYRLKKNLKLLLSSVVLYFIAMATIEIHYGRFGEWIVPLIRPGNLVRIIILNAYGDIRCAHLWFIAVLCECIILLFIIEKFKSKIVLWLIFILSIALRYFHWVYDYNYLVDIFSLLAGLPYFLFGYIIKIYEDKIFKHRIIENICCSISLLIFVIIQVLYMNGSINNIGPYDLIYKSFSGALLFVLAIINPSLKCKPIETIGYKYSTSIYILHILVWIFFGMVFNHFGGHPEDMWVEVSMSIIVVLVPILIKVIIDKLKKGFNKKLGKI